MFTALVATIAFVVAPACPSAPCTLETQPPPLPNDGALFAHAEHVEARNVFVWTAAVRDNLLRAQRANDRARAATRKHSTAPSEPRVPSVSGTGYVNGHPCGGALPSCAVLARESNGTNAQNPDGRSASGYWQIQDATWGGFMGYARAVDAPGWVQDLRAAQLGACNWEPPNYCAG